ncbi:DUF402 domain-containing protein [Kitasatospora arboriphila]
MTVPAGPGLGARFPPGATVVRRDIHHGKVWSAQPYRAITDTGTVLHLAYWPGIRSLAPTAWTTALRTGDDTARKNGLHDLAAGTWELGPWTWQHTVVRARFEPGECFSLHYFQDPVTARPLRLYVNFERPVVRSGAGIDTLDLLVDLVVEPDLSGWWWKDQDEYEQGRSSGSSRTPTTGWSSGPANGHSAFCRTGRGRSPSRGPPGRRMPPGPCPSCRKAPPADLCPLLRDGLPACSERRRAAGGCCVLVAGSDDGASTRGGSDAFTATPISVLIR